MSNKNNQKVGFTNGKILEEIASSSAELEGGISNPATKSISPLKRAIIIPQPLEGMYTIAISTSSAKAQKYSVQIISYAQDGTSETKKVEGTVTSKKSEVEKLSYSQTPKTTNYCSKVSSNKHIRYISWHELECKLSKWFHRSR